jgi:Na+-translocating ferredoxin:NAD+ oxidoreductase subunit C
MKNMMEKAEKLHALSCIECGACAYICPSKIPLLQAIKLAKNNIYANKRKQTITERTEINAMAE